MTTKIDFIRGAYTRCEISGLTSNPTPEEITLGLKRLESMASRWADKGICVDYNFETIPEVNSTHNVPRKYEDAFESNLAMRLLSAFGKQATPELKNDARSSYSDLASSTAVIPEMCYPSTMPIGSGNRRYGNWQKYYPPIEKAPIECATAKMAIGDIDNFFESFSAYLVNGETLDTVVLTPDDGLTITNETVDSPRFTYTVEAVGGSGENEFSTWFQVKIVATMSSGRIETRIKNFELTTLDID
jgi:hypothetical protein